MVLVSSIVSCGSADRKTDLEMGPGGNKGGSSWQGRESPTTERGLKPQRGWRREGFAQLYVKPPSAPCKASIWLADVTRCVQTAAVICFWFINMNFGSRLKPLSVAPAAGPLLSAVQSGQMYIEEARFIFLGSIFHMEFWPGSFVWFSSSPLLSCFWWGGVNSNARVVGAAAAGGVLIPLRLASQETARPLVQTHCWNTKNPPRKKVTVREMCWCRGKRSRGENLAL